MPILTFTRCLVIFAIINFIAMGFLFSQESKISSEEPKKKEEKSQETQEPQTPEEELLSQNVIQAKYIRKIQNDFKKINQEIISRGTDKEMSETLQNIERLLEDIYITQLLVKTNVEEQDKRSEDNFKRLKDFLKGDNFKRVEDFIKEIKSQLPPSQDIIKAHFRDFLNEMEGKWKKLFPKMNKIRIDQFLSSEERLQKVVDRIPGWIKEVIDKFPNWQVTVSEADDADLILEGEIKYTKVGMLDMILVLKHREEEKEKIRAHLNDENQIKEYFQSFLPEQLQEFDFMKEPKRKKNIVFVIDCSSSMIPYWKHVQKIVKEEMISQLQSVHHQYKFGFVFYKSSSKDEDKVHPSTIKLMSFSEAYEQIDNFRPSGGDEANEPVYLGLWKAINETQWESKEFRTRQIILIGNANDGKSILKEKEKLPIILAIQDIKTACLRNKTMVKCYDCSKDGKLETFKQIGEIFMLQGPIHAVPPTTGIGTSKKNYDFFVFKETDWGWFESKVDQWEKEKKKGANK